MGRKSREKRMLKADAYQYAVYQRTRSIERRKGLLENGDDYARSEQARHARILSAALEKAQAAEAAKVAEELRKQEQHG